MRALLQMKTKPAMIFRQLILGWMLLVGVGPHVLLAEEALQARKMTTPDGVLFGLVGDRGEKPAPALVIFAKDWQTSLQSPDFNLMGRILRRERGFVLIALDLPAHGADRRPNEPAAGLVGWRQRMDKGEDIVAEYMPKVSAVLDFLIAQHVVDPTEIGVCGTSRGGFMALHFMAADSRVKWAATFSPVTDLLGLKEFNDTLANAHARSLALTQVASKLAGRPIWMSIGNSDDRVGTDLAISLSRRLVEEARAQGKFPDVDLHVTTGKGHSSEPEDLAAAGAWVLVRHQDSGARQEIRLQ